MTDFTKREVLRVGFISLVPRKVWRKAEYVATSIMLVVGLTSIGGTWVAGNMLVAGVAKDDQDVQVNRAALVARVTPLVAMQERLSVAERNTGNLLTQRQSGLLIAKKVIVYGDAIGHDGVATMLDASGRVDGYAPNFAAISRIWSRLGEGVTLTEARPSGSSIAFSFVASPTASSAGAPTAPGAAPAASAPASANPPVTTPAQAVTAPIAAGVKP
jgi:hypothetical protein